MANLAVLAQLQQLVGQLNALQQTVGNVQASNNTLTTRIATLLEAENTTLTTANTTLMALWTDQHCHASGPVRSLLQEHWSPVPSKSKAK